MEPKMLVACLRLPPVKLVVKHGEFLEGGGMVV